LRSEKRNYGKTDESGCAIVRYAKVNTRSYRGNYTDTKGCTTGEWWKGRPNKNAMRCLLLAERKKDKVRLLKEQERRPPMIK